VLGATPDAKVVDVGCSVCFGLADVKCPHTKFHVTPAMVEAIKPESVLLKKYGEGDRGSRGSR